MPDSLLSDARARLARHRECLLELAAELPDSADPLMSIADDLHDIISMLASADPDGDVEA